MNYMNTVRFAAALVLFGLALLGPLNTSPALFAADAGSLQQAAALGDVGLVERFLLQGIDIDTRDENGFTALHLAARHGALPVANLLVSKKAEIDARDRGSWTPLHDAAQNGQAAMVSLLIAAGADVNAENLIGETPLHNAAEQGDKLVAGLLIAGGAEINAHDDHGWTPLDMALFFENLETERVLATMGAYCNIMSGERGDRMSYREMAALSSTTTLR